MADDNLTFFEKRLQRELEDIERRIKELNIEKEALSRQLSKARAEREGLQFSTRKNSMNRVLAENSVMKSLREKKDAVSTAALYRNARLTHYDLKENTFRTYLNRMKEKGLIKASRRFRAHWVLPDNTEGK
jgi:hypothetical protein